MTERRWMGTLLGVVTLDQLSKWALKDADHVLIPGILRLRGVRNEGAAFGLLGAAPQLLLVLTTLAVVLLAAYLWRSRPQGLFGIGLALVLAGAVGNLIDRLLLGYVIDFFELLFVRFAIFNVADIAVTAGCGLCILSLWTDREAAHG